MFVSANNPCKGITALSKRPSGKLNMYCFNSANEVNIITRMSVIYTLLVANI